MPFASLSSIWSRRAPSPAVPRRRRRAAARHRAGFTLSELMLVLVMISVLASVATNTFRRVKEAAYKSDLQAAISAFRSAEETYLDQYGEFAVDYQDLGLQLSPGIIVLDYDSPRKNYWSVLLRHAQGRFRCTGAYESPITCFNASAIP